MKTYRSISCEFHYVLEAFSTIRENAELEYREGTFRYTKQGQQSGVYLRKARQGNSR